MIQVNVHEAKTHLSKYLKKVAKGETIILCKRNVPVAELRAVARPRTARRPLGQDRGKMQMPPEFFDPLPDELMAHFDGRRS